VIILAQSKLFLDAITATMLDIPTKSFIVKEERAVIKNLNPKNAMLRSNKI